MSSHSSAPITPTTPCDLSRFAASVSVLSVIIRAQYQFRANRRSYQMLQRAKRNKQKRCTEMDMQKKLQAKFGAQASNATPTGKFDSTELAARAAALQVEREAAREAFKVVNARRDNAALSAVHADLSAVHEARQAKARAEQLRQCQADMVAKIAAASGAPSRDALARREVSDVIKQRAADPVQSMLAKELRARSDAAAAAPLQSLRSESREVVRQRRDDALIASLNKEIKSADKDKLRSVVALAKDEQDQDMQAKLRSKRRATATKTLDQSVISEVRMD